MEPELIVLEEGTRFWIVEQRWGWQAKYTNTLGYLARPDYQPASMVPHELFEAGFIWSAHEHYEIAYRRWCEAENRRGRNPYRPKFVYIVEACTKRQVVDAMAARGIITMFNQKWVQPSADLFIGTATHGLIEQMGSYLYPDNKEIVMYESSSEARLKVLERRQALLDQEMLKEIERQERMARFGADSDYADDTVITWEQRYEKNGLIYTFVALKVNGRWYTTSTFQKQSWGWDVLVEEYLSKAEEGSVHIVTEWTQI